MVEIEEENFPRGGFRPRLSVKRPKEDDNLFSHSTRPKTKKLRKEKVIATESINEENFHSSLKIQGTLTYNKIRTDMIILGCIRHITNFSIEVELPGLTFGYVNITNISDPFTKYLNSKLEQPDEESDTLLKKIFKIGQFVLTKVINIESRDKGIHLECSLNSREIYSDKSHSSFEKGMLVWGSVQSELEHGYEINVGVKNCRVFLPSKNVDADKKLFIGEPLWCTINKCESSNVASTLRVTSKKEHLKNSKIEEINSLYDLIPGMQIEIMVDKITNSGIHGKFINDFYGYIDEGHLNKDLSKFQEGNLLNAYILFVDHTVKVTYFTTFELNLVQTPQYKIGDTLIAEVISKASNGIYLKLPSKERCIVTNKRLINSLPKKSANIDISETLRLKFAPKSRHNCRILDYNHLSRTYIGTVEQSLIKEGIFTPKDVALGQLLDVVVENIKSEGLVVSVGHVKAFVPNLYLSNIKYSETIKKKFKEGQKIKARVLNVEDGNILLTLKPGQVDSEECLTDLAEAKRGDRYPGVVIQTKPNGALIVFYGNVKGWISKKYLDEQNIDQKPDPQLFFFRGQVVNPWVLGVKNDRVVLSIRQPKDFETFGSLAVGLKIDGVISDIKKDKIYVKTLRGKPVGIVPINHLASNLSLCPIIIKTFKIGDPINNLICINNSSTPNILSKRESLALKRCPKHKLKHLSKLRPGNIVRCSYLSECDLGIYVLPLILDFTEKILIKKKDIVNKGIPLPKFEPYQSIVTKIVKIQHESKKICLTAKLSEVFDNSVEGVLSLFSEYLTDIQTIRNFGHSNNWDICKYYPGDRLECHVEKLGDKGGCLVKLPNGANGLVTPHLCPDHLKIGQKITGVFLSQNFPGNYVDMCLRSDICQKINPIQDGEISCLNLSSCISENLLLRTDLGIALLKPKDGKKQLVFMPLLLHENDFESCKQFYMQEKFKICICGKVNNLLVGMSKKLFVTLDKNKEKITQIKALRNENDKDVKKLSSPNDKENNIKLPDVQEQPEAMQESEEESQEIEEEIEEMEVELQDVDEKMKNVQDKDTDQIKEKTFIAIGKRISFGNKEVKSFSSNDSITGPLPVLSSVSSFFNTNTEREQDMSSDDELQETIVKKKKKLSAAERAQKAREEEDRISKIEKELADSTRAPESAEQFDRLLLANPNSSELWTKYIAFHTAATEFDKARVVAKRALEAINMTLIDERFNIWIALLNLENMLGSKESFEETFIEAVRYNDSLQVYLKVIQMLSEAGKLADMEEKIRKVKNKHKQIPQMWLEIAKTYYQLGKFKEARNMKDAALKSIDNKKTQLEIIVKFAIMEFKFGDPDHGAAIFETILSSDPKKVTIWTTYVDQLVKKDNIDQARQILERSTCQRLPLKSMKTLFLKFRMFEEQHGTPESVEIVKEKAKEYVDRISAK